MKYKAFIFDFDMTLADSSKVIFELLNTCSSDLGYGTRSFDYVFPVIGNSHEKMLFHVTGEKDQEKLLKLRDNYRELCRTKMAEKTELFDGVADTLKEMKKNGRKLGLVSLKLRDVLMEILKKYELEDVFSSVVGCEEVKAQKPDPSGLFVALKQLNVEKEEALYVGDSLLDEGAAKAAGMDFCAMVRGSTKLEEFDPSFVIAYYTNIEDLWKDQER